MDSIPFLVNAPEQSKDSAQKGIFTIRDEQSIALANIPVDRLKANFRDVTKALMAVLTDVQQVGQFKLKEVELQVEVTAEGGIEFIGTTKLGGKGAIKLTFSE